jgi:hypothetical protein
LDVTKKADFYIQEGQITKKTLLWHQKQTPTFKVSRIREFQDTADSNDTLFVGYVRLDSAVM